MPVGAKLDDGVVEFGGDAARHADDHAFTSKDFLTRFKVGNDILGDGLDALRVADEGFYFGAVGFGFLGFGHIVVGKVFVELGDQLASGVAEADFGEAAFVVDADGGSVFYGLGDVVDVYIVAEYGGGVGVGFLDGGAGEAEVGGVGQGVAQVFGEAVDDFFTDDGALLVGFVDGFGA